MNQPSSPQPNIILILVDDMGYSDIGCFGSEIQTPHLDRMAASGLRFSQMYNYARCCPTRACLLTGLYPHQAGVGHMVDNRGTPQYQGYLNDKCVTIAEALKQGGYRTYMSGKWHVGGAYDPLAPESWRPGEKGHPTPRQRGFDRFYGTLDGAGSFFHPHSLLDDDTSIRPKGEDFYYTDAISQNAAGMIEEAARHEAPFFLYVGYTAPHWPLHALPEDIAKYEGSYHRGGWDALRTARHETLKGMGILDQKWEISPRDENAPAWSETGHKDWEDMRMAVYAAQVDRMDQGVGTIMAKLHELDLEENTLVIFMSDNGGCAEFLAEDGWSQRYASQTPDGRPIRTGNIPAVQPGGPDTFMSYDLPWANASNSPFRLYKHWVHEGGISTPMIVHWPATIKHSEIIHEPCHIVDIMATCLDVTGIAYPTEHNDCEITPMEGESFAPLLYGQDWTRSRPIFWEHEGNRAVRFGQWKVVSKFPDNWELYDMVEDRTELNNLLDKNRPVATDMIRQYQLWAARCGVADWPLS